MASSLASELALVCVFFRGSGGELTPVCYIGGALYYAELYSFSAVQYAMFFFGLTLLLCGVIILSRRLHPDQLPYWCVPTNWLNHCGVLRLCCNLSKFGLRTKDEKDRQNAEDLEMGGIKASLTEQQRAAIRETEQQLVDELQEISLQPTPASPVTLAQTSPRTPLRPVTVVVVEEITVVPA